MAFHPLEERGIVLVVVLWIITLLSVMAASFSYSMRTETLLTAHSVERAQARALAEAGIANVMLQSLDPDPRHRQWVDGVVREWNFGSAVLRIDATDVGGKVDINRADRNLLKGLLKAAGVADDQLDSLLDAIADWRDPDDLRRLNGAELQEYQAAGRTLGPMNAPFTRVEELQQVLGMTPEIYQRLEPWLTVNSYQAGVDVGIASAELLRALPDVEPEVVNEYLKERADSQEQGQPLPQPPQAIRPYYARSRGLTYHVVVTVQLESGASTSIEAIVSRRGAGTGKRPPAGDDTAAEPYSILAWREGR
ncbi:MAG: general secretion pathway protein GspK [Gammaproteobacteria bacterium]|nr:general secretion pathway protein GspK [Gammaproteobacteria bacterium]MCP5423714.1 general secretion pathway protein GspK [Gammaproteobacteria bacterium]